MVREFGRGIPEGSREQENINTLIIPEDPEHVARLGAKLDEYIARDSKDDTIPPEQKMDTVCKRAILAALVNEGSVNYDSMRTGLQSNFGSGFDISAFDNAWRVVEDYVKTGGKNATRGTGFPAAAKR